MGKDVTKKSAKSKKTIVIICMVVILIAACFLFAYYYFNKNNTQDVTITSLTTQSEITADASSALIVLKNYYSQNRSYPTANNCTNPTASEVCLVSDNDNITYDYKASANDSYKTYLLEITDKDSGINYVLSTISELYNTNNY